MNMGAGTIECKNGEKFADGITNGAAWYPSNSNILFTF